MSNFTNSSLISLTNLSPNRNSPRNQEITKITIHHFAGNSTIEGVSNFLANPARQASYNYGIGSDGRIVLIVEERDRCWASSSRENDHRAVVIGVANNGGAPDWPVSDTAFDMLIDLCVDICRRNPGITQRNGKPGLWYDGTSNGSLTRHNMFSNQTCPGRFLQSRFPEICRLVNERLETDSDYSFDEENQIIDDVTCNLTPIMGIPVATAGQMRTYIARINPSVLDAIPDLTELFISEGLIEGVRGDIAFAQSCLETGNFMFVGGTAVALSQNNFSGMGVTSLGVRGNYFPTPQIGIRAQIHHLKAYACIQPTVNPNESPRARFVKRGVAPYVEWLGVQENPQGRGWATGVGYGERILRILNAIIATEAVVNSNCRREEVREALEKLASDNIINSPDYWMNNFHRLEHLDTLIINMGSIEKTTDTNSEIETVDQAISRLVYRGVINSPDYWLANYSQVEWLDTLMINVANRLQNRK